MLQFVRSRIWEARKRSPDIQPSTSESTTRHLIEFSDPTKIDKAQPMIVKETEFVGSFGALSQLPHGDLPEIGFVGRSNVGKSSLINKLLGVRRLAMTSSRPGKTRTINFFRVNSVCHFVDLPGYGFSRVSKREQAGWRRLIEGYLLDRESLRLLILLIDARHGALANDRQMIGWLRSNALPHQIVLTKADKLGGNRLAAERRALADPAHELHGAILCSAQKGFGTREIWSAIDGSLEYRQQVERS